MEHIRENGVKVLEWPSKDAEFYLVGGAKYDVAILVAQLFWDCVGHGKEDLGRGTKVTRADGGGQESRGWIRGSGNDLLIAMGKGVI